MEILISFTTTVGVVEALRTTKDVAVDIVNQSIVLWLKNKKFPDPIGRDPWNNRDVNRGYPPMSFYPQNMWFYIYMASFNGYDYQEWHYYGGALIITEETIVSNGIVNFTYTRKEGGVLTTISDSWGSDRSGIVPLQRVSHSYMTRNPIRNSSASSSREGPVTNQCPMSYYKEARQDTTTYSFYVSDR